MRCKERWESSSEFFTGCTFQDLSRLSRPFKTFQDLSRFVKTFQDFSRTIDKLSNVYPRLDFSRPMELALQRLFMFIPRWEVKPALSWKYSSQNIFPGNPVNIKMQVSLMSHSCVANLEVVDPPSRSIAFRVKRPVSWSLSYFPQCIGIEIAPGINSFSASCEDPRLKYLNPKSESAVAWKGKVQ